MKKLTRSRDDKWIGGVCGGVADLTGIDVTLIRIILAIATVLGAGSLLIAYVVAWILIPRRPTTAWPTTLNEPAQPSQ